MKKVGAGQNLPFLLLGILIFVMSVFLGALSKKQPTGADSLGYVYAGKQLADAHNLKFTDSHNVDSGPYFYLHMYRMVEPDSADATFCCPPGAPLLFAIGDMLTAIQYVVPLMAVVGIIATFWFGRLVTQNWWAGLWAAAILSGTTLFWEFSTLPLTNLPSLTFIMLGVSFFVLAQQSDGKKTMFIALMSGFFIGFSFFIRYTNAILVGPGIALYALHVAKFDIVRDKRQWVFWGTIVLFSGGLLLYNWHNLGGPFNTVYSTPELGAYPWPMFSWRYAFGPSPINGYSAPAIIQTLWQNFFVLLLLAPVGWMLLPKSCRVLSAGIVLTTVGLYANYAFSPQGDNARFLLPIFPFFAVAIAQTITMIGRLLPEKHWRWILAVLVLILVFAQIPAEVDKLQRRNRAGNGVIVRVHEITAQLPSDAVFMSIRYNDLLAFYADRSVLNYRRILRTDPEIGRFDGRMFEACLVQTIDRLHAQSVPVYFIEEKSWNMPTLLKTHFELVDVLPDLRVQAVLPPGNMGSRVSLGQCSY